MVFSGFKLMLLIIIYLVGVNKRSSHASLGFIIVVNVVFVFLLVVADHIVFSCGQ